MKKYLMTGIAALALSAGFTSCSHDIEPMTQEEINQIEAQKIVQTYEQAFIKTFGQPAANQNWGFGAANTRGVDADGNHWAASDYGKWKVPPVLKPEQIAAVVEYFQTVKKPRYQDPQWTNYFIQQVYKGGDSPREGYSPEKYTAANGSTKIVGSDHMDHLAAIDPDAEGGEFVDHNNNFNHGDCGAYGNVLAYEEGKPHSANDTQYQYSDKINLMVNSTTKSFGYYNSNSSVRRTEYTGLVSYQTIIDELGEAKAGCLRDGWNRSFMGFDFEMMVGPEIYAKNDDGSIKYLTYGDLPDAQYAWDGVSDYGGPIPAKTDFVLLNGEKIPVLDSRTNMYAGENGDIDQNAIITSHSCLSGYQYNQETQKEDKPYYQNQNCLNLKVLSDKIAAKYCLVDGSKGCKWVKVGGTADEYYSDWIVTLTEAKQYDTDTTNPGGGTTEETSNADLRIMAEDLSASDDTDFDFNDVVFDVYYGAAGTAKIEVLAAGGTLPLRIKTGAGNTDDDFEEVHGMFGENTNIMINTNASYANSKNGLDAVPRTLDYAVNNAAEANGITIQVKKTVNGEEQWIEMKAAVGQPAAKFACLPSVVKRWANERESLLTNSNFKDWVQGAIDKWQWNADIK